MTYNVTCNTDDNYAQHCCAMLCSLFEHNNCDFHIHILIHNLSIHNIEQLKKLCCKYNNKCSFYDVDESKLEGVKFRKERPLTKAAYYRILLPEILNKNINKVLYLDCDIIILDDIKEIYEINLDNYALAACVDASPYNSLHRKQLGLDIKDNAFCSGIMMINLKYWRDNNSEEKLIEYSKRERKIVFLHDQDSFNYVFKNQWFVLPPKWNRGIMTPFQFYPNAKIFDYKEYLYSPKLIHYASKTAKPWYDVKFPERNHYIKYLKCSGYDSPKFIKRTLKQKISVYKDAMTYYLNRYLRAWVPNSIELIIKDILDLFFLFAYLFFNRKKLKEKLILKRISKYRL